ncbi:nicotinate phosphoribosyltransferase [Paenibacillus endoradicis]|uniref:nicotinate phosphoribosyltransferase n=1 Tax=Paenibacillus endoradicis TaxID=2972487 RepID=UPI002159830F|nr:nicotinate phosphoribosyltransferase [Paenibacillus endoradicis]MCR8656530.1 nicotinate phosphoribosyltransferase [Paenibacillus endoradicis]
MRYNLQDDSVTLHTDRYQINMAEVYWRHNEHQKQAIFEVYFRKLPFDNGYAVFAGLERVVHYLQDFKFSETDLQYLREEGYQDDFLTFLKTIRFTGKLRSIREGEVVFANEPLMVIEAPLVEAQLIETAILNIVNYQTLIATKASRLKNIIGNQTAMEFGTRRAQEMDAAIWGTRAAYLAGFDATSNVRAGKLFGIPIAGTHAHSLVQVYRDEYVAFKKYAQTHRDCVFLVDTYDTLKSGVPTAIKVAKEMKERINFVGIRLDSGDLAYLSKEARKMLDGAGFKHTKIYASNDLDEDTILSLKREGACIDVWGIGTKLITAYTQPALGAVYKLVQIEDEGQMVDTIKISSNPDKISNPGNKQMWRIINMETGIAEGDYITLINENLPQDEIKLVHPLHSHMKKTVKNFKAIQLLVEVMVKGELVYDLPTLDNNREYAKQSLALFWEEYRRLLNPPIYPVTLSDACWNNKRQLIEKALYQTREER